MKFVVLGFCLLLLSCRTTSHDENVANLESVNRSMPDTSYGCRIGKDSRNNIVFSPRRGSIRRNKVLNPSEGRPPEEKGYKYELTRSNSSNKETWIIKKGGKTVGNWTCTKETGFSITFENVIYKNCWANSYSNKNGEDRGCGAIDVINNENSDDTNASDCIPIGFELQCANGSTSNGCPSGQHRCL